MRFRLVWYITREENKYEAHYTHEYFGNEEAIWRLWYALAKELGYPHVEVYSLDGRKQTPEEGMHTFTDYSV